MEVASQRTNGYFVPGYRIIDSLLGTQAAVTAIYDPFFRGAVLKFLLGGHRHPNFQGFAATFNTLGDEGSEPLDLARCELRVGDGSFTGER